MPEQVLRDAETAAEKSRGDSSDGAVDEARSAEGEKYYTYRDLGNGTFAEEEHFRSNVSGRKSGENAKGKFKGGLKKKGPLVVIIVLLGLFAGLIFAAQSIMPFSVVNRIIEEYNTNGISSVLRADNILDFQLSAAPGSTFAFTDHQKSSLKENDVLPVEYGGGTLLAYKSGGNGTWKVVHGTAQANVSVVDVTSSLQTTYSGFAFNTVSLVSIDDAMEDIDFKKPYTTASKTWRGGIAGWYDSITSLNESIRGLQRSRIFLSGVTKLNRLSRKAAKSVMKSRGIDEFGSADSTYTPAATQADGSTTEASTTIETSSSSGFNKAALKAATVVNAVSKVASGACMYVEVANRLQTIIQAVSSLQQMNLITGFTESVQMVQVGDDTDGTIMNEYATNLTEKDANGKTAIESAGMGAMYTGDAINPNDESVKTATAEGAIANLSNSSNPVSSFLGTTAGITTNFLDAMTTCTYIEGTLSVVSTILTVVGVATGGAAKLFEFAIKLAVNYAVSALIQKFSSLLVDWFWDNYGKVLANDLATAVFGEDLGNALISGANKYLSSNHQTGGGSPATKTALLMFKRQQDVVIAEEAEYQRSIRSPFDINSQYTFLGSIVYSLVPMANTSSTGSVVKTMGGLLKNSVINLLPTASAVAETNMVNSIGDCPTLESIGIVGDAYCNPYFISDTSTNTSVAMKRKLGDYDTVASLKSAYSTSTGNSDYLSPDEVIEAVYNLGGIESKKPSTITDSKGQTQTAYKIVKDSNLYKYARYCGARTSSWGFADANIAQELKTSRNDNWWNKIPIIGDLISSITDMINAGEDKDWISGYNCVAREPSSGCSECDDDQECFWQNHGKYYQRFIEDQRYLLSSGDETVTADPVSLAMNEYYAEHPLDQSFEGILARYSGMTKDDVIATLELIDGLTYLANYRPEERLAFGEEESETDLQFESAEDTLIALEPKYIIYNTLRNRSNAIL